ncbi:hypothetical protein FT663_00580 [Candidozyma haemuli var. vulneris]|uniref:Uncharacterized protein n=1 Tax=Candidozyma haemuli TaxID=45357 RepID=A0A2V1B0B1_9ASCO|nr:hypothetical protein CXQ85_004053 [[Candida] haemuloni]KAF3993306.1 hypothetical protein FT662_00686 [[Candida] haemuloni var. vulneris]KAF3995362.1 hypothetical protein FT663_00580 [[Candida] haemuloni var. vulneris]PVH23760.1 hypothetical protein CXQ85_004053 [[Candida] haemuloni]
MPDEQRSSLLAGNKDVDIDPEQEVGGPSTIHETAQDQSPDGSPDPEDIEIARWGALHPKTWKDSVKRFFVAWVNGPAHPRDDPPRPIGKLRQIELLPDRFRLKVSPSVRYIVFMIYMLVWIAIWSRVLLPYFTEMPEVAGDPDATVISLTCSDSYDFWKGKNAACGLDAKSCPKLHQDKDVIIRCPALCDRGSWLYSSRAVGDQMVKYRGLFVGGGKKDKGDDGTITYPYRADSFPCGAGVHAGIISPFYGGCARASFASGPQTSFPATKGKYGVSDSIQFSSFFPTSYVFQELEASVSHCKDPRLVVLIMNIILGLPIVVLGSSAVFVWTITSVGFWTISLATDPPKLVNPAYSETFYELISLSLGRFLPTCFVMYFLWKVSIKRTFSKPQETIHEEEYSPGLTPSSSPMSRIIFWYPFFWLGVLNNITFDRLPVDRLTWKDLQAQPGALLTVSVFAVIIIVCVVTQAYSVWLSGRFNKLIKIYIMMFASLFAIAWIPGLTLRIHHYIFALMFIPGCSTRGRTAYVFQGLLLGLFLSGVARWGYASIAETNLSLLRGEPAGRVTPPTIFDVNATEGRIYWEDSFDAKKKPIDEKVLLKELTKYSEVSLLINDVERYRGKNEGSLNITELVENNKYLNDLVSLSMSQETTPSDVDLYLRIARYDPNGKRHGDFTKAYILQYPSFNLTKAAAGVT